MSHAQPERLYALLPALHRIRDAEQGEPLRALLQVVETEFDRIEYDCTGLYENWFIETCAEWVVPYIGDLLGVRPIRAVESAQVSTRAYVANTIRYRRRKGTAVVLEQLARDTTGWPARAVEFFARLATTQHLNHVRRAPTATPDLRDAALAELTGSDFDAFAHTLEVRGIAAGRGRYNIPNVGLYLWRLDSYPIGRGRPGDETADFGSARRMTGPEGAYYSFHPTGRDAPLFNKPRTESTITHLAEEHNVPGPLRRLELHAELDRLRKSDQTRPPRFMLETDPALRVLVELAEGTAPVEVRREDIYLCEIPADAALASPPLAVAIDPRRGRLAFAGGIVPRRVLVAYSYGFSGDLGGGPYDRTRSVVDAGRIDAGETDDSGRGGFFDPGVWMIGVTHLHAEGDASGLLFATLRDAVTRWNAQPPGTTGVIVVMDSLSEHDSPGSPSLPVEIRLGERSRLLIVAGDWPRQPPVGARVAGQFQAAGVRPHLLGDLVVRGTAPQSSADPGACFVNGLLIEGRITVADGHLGLLHVAHATLVPDLGGITVAGGNDRLRLVLARAICGPVTTAAPIRRIDLADSILDAAATSPALALFAPETEATIERSSFFGAVLVQSISASDSIFCDPVHAARRQTGCVRFCYVPPGAAVPRRYRCQPDLAVAARLEEAREQAARRGASLSPAENQAVRDEIQARIKPLFGSRRYGDPEYAQLELRAPAELRTGAESGAEMGAFCFLDQPHRADNLTAALSDYLRFGLEAGTIFVT